MQTPPLRSGAPRPKTRRRSPNSAPARSTKHLPRTTLPRTWPGTWRRPGARTCSASEIDDPQLDTLLAIDDGGSFAGFAQLQAERAPACVATHKPVELKRFYVDKPWQGRGLARELMAAVEREARARGARELWLGVWERNERAQAFYRKCGFRAGGNADLHRRQRPTDGQGHAQGDRVSARIEHVALWVRDLDALAAFYSHWFGASVGKRYENPRKGFASRFLEFGGGARLEVMTRTDIGARAAGEQLGLAHIAISVGNEAAVDALAARLTAQGIAVIDGPRRTGDGYYECVIRDPEGNRVEIAAG